MDDIKFERQLCLADWALKKPNVFSTVEKCKVQKAHKPRLQFTNSQNYLKTGTVHWKILHVEVYLRMETYTKFKR